MVEDGLVIRSFLSRFNADDIWLDGKELLTAGVVESLMAVELLRFLERTFSMVILDEDLELENFNSIDGMLALIKRKRSTPTAACQMTTAAVRSGLEDS
jgi:acyl carrier protein